MSVSNIRIVLSRPIYGGNIGSVCRVMENFGFSDLVIVAPSKFNMDEAKMMACNSQGILQNRREVEDLFQAVSDCSVVVATTARGGLYRQHALSPRELALRMLESSYNGKAAIVFGNEKDGLSNEELALCTHVLRIPTSIKKSLNVAQAVAICCYEIFIASGTYVPEKEKSNEASLELKERMFRAWKEAMVKTGFADEIRVEHMMFGLKRIFSRGAVTEDDVSILMGLARQVVWCASNMRVDIEKKNQRKVLEIDFSTAKVGNKSRKNDEGR